MRLKSQTQAFNDGVLSIYKVENIAEKGNTPVDGLALKTTNQIPYEERIVGMSRFWTAMQYSIKVERMLRIPRINNVLTNDVIIPIDGEQYIVKQVQFVQDVEPQCIDLSLERLGVPYDVATS